jgi:hypothetical protein
MWCWYCFHLASLDEGRVDTVDHSKLRSIKMEGISIVTVVVPGVMKNSQFVYIVMFCSKMNGNYDFLGYHAV